MATSKMKVIKKTLKKAIDYIANPDKTNDGQLVFSHGCSVETADLEMEITAKQGSGRGDRIAYHLIQSFAPEDDITPEQALELGKEFARKVTGGNCEFIAATHVDKGFIHNHIIFNAVNYVDYTKYHSDKKDKYRIRDINDEICKANDLLVLPQYDAIRKHKYENKHKEHTAGWKEKLKVAIDNAIKNTTSFDEFLYEMEMEGYEIKRGKYIAFHAPGQERNGRAAYTRAKSLGNNYTEEALRFRIEHKENEVNLQEPNQETNHQNTSSDRKAKSNSRKVTPYQAFRQKKINLLIDISKNIKAQKSKGYELALVRSNINTLVKTMNYLVEHKLETSEEFAVYAEGKNAEYQLCRRSVKKLENELLDLSEKIKFTQNYKKYKPVYEQSKRMNNKDEFLRAYQDEIVLYRASSMYFERNQIEPNAMNLGELFERYRIAKQEKIEMDKVSKSIHKEISELNTIAQNIETALGIDMAEKRQDEERTNSNDIHQKGKQRNEDLLK